MTSENRKPDGTQADQERGLAGYEAPRVESVMTSDDLERESLYGGITVT